MSGRTGLLDLVGDMRLWPSPTFGHIVNFPLAPRVLFCKCSIRRQAGAGKMVARVSTVAFEGVEARPVDVQVHVLSGTVAFTIVGLGDKAVAESRERVRSALIASGLALPAKRITVNLAPADLPKEGSHYDLPIALGVMAAIGAVPHDALEGYAVIGELALDGAISAVAGVLPAAIAANAAGKGLICPASCGPEAAWASADLDILAPRSLIQLANHFRGTQILSRPQPAMRPPPGPQPDLSDIKGQESAKRALEIAAAGGHHLLMSGAPGAGKSMLAQRLPSILPPLTPRELLEVSMIHSVAGALAGGVSGNAGRSQLPKQRRQRVDATRQHQLFREDGKVSAEGVIPIDRSNEIAQCSFRIARWAKANWCAAWLRAPLFPYREAGVPFQSARRRAWSDTGNIPCHDRAYRFSGTSHSWRTSGKPTLANISGISDNTLMRARTSSLRSASCVEEASIEAGRNL